MIDSDFLKLYSSCNLCPDREGKVYLPVGSFEAHNLVVLSKPGLLPNKSGRKSSRLLEYYSQFGFSFNDFLFMAFPSCEGKSFYYQCLYWLEQIVIRMPNLTYLHLDGKESCRRVGFSPTKFLSSYVDERMFCGKLLKVFMRASYNYGKGGVL